MKAKVVLSILILLISCGEVVKKSPEMSQGRIDSLETMIADLEREKVRLLKSSNEDNPIIIHLTVVRDSLAALLDQERKRE
ncbi:hypothetical protein [uncultured Eudoraea sp.]|uniref:hypothetical protein n=1 Tax=uncultured Eudoraea sp. TaxID=1035614 RepID=UPI002639859F|nr:hypothetical protein [uncultured Eudoraea sp.]